MATYDKPHLTLEQQVALLTSRGMQVHDPAEGARWLGMVGYYRLSGYWYPFRRIDEGAQGRGNQFLDGTTLTQVVELYTFDRRLKLLVLEALERIEIAMRCKVGYTLGLRGSYAHLNPDNLDGKFTETPPATPPDSDEPAELSRYDEWLAKVTEYQSRSKEDFVVHFRRRYDDRLPVWVVTEILDFGGLSVLYEGLQHADRNTIAQEFEVTDAQGGNGKALANWMQVLNHVRNVAAHHSRLWNRNFPVQLAPKHLRKVPDLAHLGAPDAQLNRLFGPLSIIAFLLERLGVDETWSTQVVELVHDSLPATGRYPAEMGLPDGWEQHFI